MSDLLVIAYPTEAQAEAARGKLLGLQKEYLIELGDAVVAVKQPDGQVKLNQLFSPVAAGVASGALWGSLLGLIVLMPLAGAALGAVVLLSLYVLFWPDPAGGGVTVPGADKAVHAGLFLLLAGTAALRFGAVRAVLAVVLSYAVGSEVVQGVLLAGRSGDAWDVLADAAGATAGWRLVRRRSARRR